MDGAAITTRMSQPTVQPHSTPPTPTEAQVLPSHQPHHQSLTIYHSTTLFTPLNALLLALLLFTLYLRLRPRPLPTLTPTPPPILFRTFTPPTLLPHNGTTLPTVYLAVRGRVFDVTPGKNFYGPGGPYANFAGRDASRGLACGSFDEDMLTEDLKGELDRLEGLGAEEMEALSGWEQRFEGKYLVVGRLVECGSKEAAEAEGRGEL